jgi:asparagine synthase (glutamine-hydrolysing)
MPSTDRAMLDAMRDSMTHRGPDDAGSYWSDDGRLGLGHRRLSIIDLSRAGHQPMQDASGRLVLTFNGEIYNFLRLRAELEERGHRFRSRTDSEVILAAYREWGASCLERLDGMFAFAIYDTLEKTLLLARDRAGEKPLFYWHRGHQIAFGSELKALLRHPDVPRQLDPDAFEHYLTYGYVPGRLCILQGFNKLRPGHGLTFDLATGHLETWQYWSLPSTHLPSPKSEEELVDELHGLLRGSMRERLVADVPLGVLLSGGLDSSLVTAVAAEVSPSPLRTFTVTFPGEGRYDESPHARLIARHFSTRHTELAAEAESVDLLDAMARQYDEPLGDPSMIPTFLVSRAIRQHATVALGGDGGDELFGGYFHYGYLDAQSRFRRWLPAPARALCSAAAAHLLPLGFRGRNQLIGTGLDVGNAIAHCHIYFDYRTRRRLMGPALRSLTTDRPTVEQQRAAEYRTDLTPLQNATRTDFTAYMVDDVLVKVDRASMLTSLEVRAPFLDPEVIEFAFGRLPDRLRVDGSRRKVLLQRLGRRLLPKEYDLSRKQGFSVPESWFRRKWGDRTWEVLSEADPGLLEPREIRKLLEGQQRGRANSERVFALTLFELWRREYGITLPG